MSSSRKKEKYQSANHLLNWNAYTPPKHTNLAPLPRPGGSSSGTNSAPRVDPQAIKKASFLQNFQFILGENCQNQLEKSCGAKSAAAINDFDSMLPWDCVKYVVVRDSFETYTCPICLEPPSAARITTCSHVYCYSCILRFLQRQKALGQPRTCPMCSAFISPSNLRPAIFFPIEPAAPQSVASFTLLTRDKNSSCLGLPQISDKLKMAKEDQRGAYLPHWGDASALFSRYSIETKELRQQQQSQDLHELEMRKKLIDTVTCGPLCEDDMMELEAITAAINFTASDTPAGYQAPKGQSDPAAAVAAPTSASSAPRPSVPAPRPRMPGLLQDTVPTNMVIGTTCTLVQTLSDDGQGAVIHTEPPSAAVGVPTGEPYVPVQLYRVSDGQQVYLHFLNVKMLKEDAMWRAGIDPALPNAQELFNAQEDVRMVSEFTAPIIDIEHITQTPKTRQAFKMMSHVPEFASFTLAFVDLKSIVMRKTMESFKKLINDRTKRLKMLKREEEHYMAGASAEHNGRWEQMKHETIQDWGQRTGIPTSSFYADENGSDGQGGNSPEATAGSASAMPSLMDLPEAALASDPSIVSGGGAVYVEEGEAQHADPVFMDLEAIAAEGGGGRKKKHGKKGGSNSSTPQLSGQAGPTAGGVGSAWGTCPNTKVSKGNNTGVTPPKPSWGGKEWSGGSINARPLNGGGGSGGANRGPSVVVAAQQHDEYFAEQDDAYFVDEDEAFVAAYTVGGSSGLNKKGGGSATNNGSGNNANNGGAGASGGLGDYFTGLAGGKKSGGKGSKGRNSNKAGR